MNPLNKLHCYRSYMHYTLLLSFCCITLQPLQAQTKPAKKPVVQKQVADSIKPITLSIKFGPFTKGSFVLAEDLKKLVQSELKIIDNNGENWLPVTFRLGWRKRDFSDDIRTGKRKMVYLFNATEVLNNTHIPDAWQKEMKESLLPGEQVLFEEIIVQHPKTKKMMQAPSLQLQLK